MVNKPKAIGTRAETAIVRACHAAGFTQAGRARLRGARDEGDIRVNDMVMIEAKGGRTAEQASDTQIQAWLAQTERERVHAGAEVAFLVTKRAGIGPANAGRWWAHMRLSDVAALRGYPASLTGLFADRDAIIRMTLASALAQIRTQDQEGIGGGPDIVETPAYLAALRAEPEPAGAR